LYLLNAPSELFYAQNAFAAGTYLFGPHNGSLQPSPDFLAADWKGILFEQTKKRNQ